jgi:isoleucyl-tRNA synthetase
VDHAGRFFQAHTAPGKLPEELIGQTVWKANPLIVEILERHGALLKQQTIAHSYPHCWRCHQPTIFRATEQWFIGMEREQLRAKTLEAIKKVKWYPAWGEDRMTNMIAMRPDWCISRQRVWGVPIVVFYCEACGEAFTEKSVLEHVVSLFREQTADVWYSKTAAELMGPGHKCAKCGGTSFRKESDILDVWFDSGSSHLAVLTPENELPWPSDMYLEGGDQYRGWFHSSLLVGVALKGGAPYRGCATHGWTLDADGRAMSKSAGNGIEPEEIVKKYGADILRLWASSVDFMEDVRLSDTILTRLSEAYRKLRNTFRYALGNLYDFDPAVHSISGSEMLEIDQWILLKAENLVRKCRAWYEELAFHQVYRAVYDFAVTDLSAVYFDVLKDRLYASAPNWKERRSGQAAMYRVHLALTNLLAPLLSFTCEEVWHYTKHESGSPESVHLSYFPEPQALTHGIPDEARARVSKWDALIKVRDAVLKSLDRAREDKLIGSSLEAAVALESRDETLDLLKAYEAQLPALFIVSQVELKEGSADEVAVQVERARGDKCERCWRYTLDIGQDSDFPTICSRCAAAVKEILQ